MCMHRRSAPAVVAANVTSIMDAADVTTESLSSAAGVPASSLSSFFDGRSELTWGELQDVGGALAVSPAVFFAGVTA